MMDNIIIGAIELAAGTVLFLLVRGLRGPFAARRRELIIRGRSVSLPARVSIDNGRLRWARLGRDGESIRVRTLFHVFEIPPEPGRIATRIEDDPNDPFTEWELQRHTDAEGRHVDVGIRPVDRRGLASLRAAPARRQHAVPFWASSVAGLLMFGAICLTALYGVSYDASATVREVGGVDADSCLVEWSHDGRTRLTHVDCGTYDAAGVGMTVPIVAQPEPFADQAFSGERREIFEIDGTILLGIAMVLGFGVWRTRRPRHATVLQPVLVTGAGGGSGPCPGSAGSHEAGRTVASAGAVPGSVIGLAAQVTRRQGWVRRPAESRWRPSPRTDLVGAATSVSWWLPLGVLAAAGLIDLRQLGLTLWVAAAAVVVIQLVRAVRCWLQLRALWKLPFTSEWDGVGLPAPDRYAVLLCLGPSPHWLVEVGDMPPADSRLRVRGDLGAGDIVHLAPIDGDDVLIGRPQRFTDELAGDVRDYLSELLGELDELDATAHD